MINISKRIEVIQNLLNQGDIHSLTYAALESRLSIELVCYDRLLMSYDNLSLDELRSEWRPKHVVQLVVENANEFADKTFTISISKTPVSDKSQPTTKTEFEELEYVKLGEQAAVDLRKLGRLWNRLAGAALHVAVPHSKDDELSVYGDESRIRKKVEDTLLELAKLQSGNLLAGSFGENCRFSCESCDFEIKRTLKFLRHGQVVYCPRPRCNESYLVHGEGEEFYFSRRVVQPICQNCKNQYDIPLKKIDELKFGQKCDVTCKECGEVNYIELRPVQVKCSDETVT